MPKIIETEKCSNIDINHPSGSVMSITKYRGDEGEAGYDSFELGGNIQISSTANNKLYSEGQTQIISEESITMLSKNAIFSQSSQVFNQAITRYTVETGNEFKKCSLDMIETDINMGTPSNHMVQKGVGDVAGVDGSHFTISNHAGGSISIKAMDPATPSITIDLNGSSIFIHDGEVTITGTLAINLVAPIIDCSTMPSVGGTSLSSIFKPI